MSKEKVFSATSKALLAGGYLVLDPIYNAYVTALSARMHAIVRQVPTRDVSTISIRSPQFARGEWSYEFRKSDFIPEEVNGRNNPFIEGTVLTILSYVNPTTIFNIEVIIFSDPGYHSQEGTTKKQSSDGQKTFLFHDKAIVDVPKTGLGSSAGLVTVISTALLSYFTGEMTKNTIHNAAQIAHCYAQKKIGSGFDVAAAVYGSIVYRRFDPVILNGILQHPYHSDPQSTALQVSFRSEIKELVNSEWEFKHESCVLPPRTRLIMGDVSGGSETPKLVSKVLNWRKSNKEEADELYDSLNQANDRFITSLTNLHHLYKQNPHEYNKGIEYFQKRNVALIESDATEKLALHSNFGPFYELISSIKDIRSNLRKLTSCTGAEIEPPQQTALLDRCNTINGCFGGVVPGAGGYDALCLLVVDDVVGTLITDTKKDEGFSEVSWLNLQEDGLGLTEESIEQYRGLY